jgi:dipeptidyl aminopeptidase/acylaminoacyl peptidase
MKKNWPLFLFAFLYLALIGALFFLPGQDSQKSFLSPLGSSFFNQPKPLEKYSFENLRKRPYLGSEIKLEKIIKQEEKYTSWLFSFQSDGKKVTGMLNLPKKEGKRPVVVMIRGYADDQVYFTGLGTRKGAGVFAENGFITLAPDFLGFGGSDTSSADILEARFERPITVLNLLASIKNLPQADSNKIFLWAHSNGGQITLSVLEINQKAIPTVLWAPVTKGFPESVLQYMGEMDDQGLKVKKAIDDFLNLYDSKGFSIDQYWGNIEAPLQVHQGTADEYIHADWTDSFVQTLKDLGKNITYYKYPRNDHNLSRDWDLVVQRDLEFFKKFF